MRKFLIIFLLSIASTLGSAFAESSFLLTENDTLNKQYFDTLSYKTYPSPGGGYVSGNNAYIDRSKVQEFHAGGLCNIYGVIVFFGYKSFSSLSDSSYIGINYYLLDNTGRNTVSTTAKCPGSVFYRDSIKVADIDTVNGNVLNYTNPLFTDSNFAVGIDFDQLNIEDTVALFTNKDGDAGSREQSWEQDLSSNWFTLKYNWPLNVDYAIFPIVNTAVGINTIAAQSQNYTISPNPTQAGLVSINLPKSAITSLQVYTNNLQLVNSELVYENEQSTVVKFDALAKGVYFVQVRTKDSMHIQKLLLN